jgi:hypothetical protein
VLLGGKELSGLGGSSFLHPLNEKTKVNNISKLAIFIEV